MSLSEIFYKALGNTVLGMGTVFFVLIFISLVISAFRWLPKLEAALTKKEGPGQGSRKGEPPTQAERIRGEGLILEAAEDEGLTAGGLTVGGLTDEGLTVGGLTDEGLTVGGLTDEEVAVISAAAIAVFTGSGGDGYIVRRIRRYDG